MSGMRRKHFYDVERPVCACNDKQNIPYPSVDELVDEAPTNYHNISHFVLSTLASEPSPGCQYWPIVPIERFQGLWNHTLRNPVLILANTVSRKDGSIYLSSLLTLIC